MVDLKTIKTLEFDKILQEVAGFAVSEPGRREVLSIMPSSTINEAQTELDKTQEMYYACHKYNVSNILSFDDVSSALYKAGIGGVLQPSDLLKIARLLCAIRIIKKQILATGVEVKLLKELFVDVEVNHEVEVAIGDAVANDTEIKDSASTELRSIRQRIASTDARLKEKLASYTRKGAVSKYLQDSIVTVRNGRFVLPVKNEHRSEIPGLIHDKSDSGATVFIEPMVVVELNNELKTLQAEEGREIERILRNLSSMVAIVEKNIEKALKIATMLDIISAKMHFGVAYKAIKPMLNTSGHVKLVRARHPLIDKHVVVPVDIEFGKNFSMLLVTGPNTGGKTVALKTAGLFCVMAYSGMYVPCGDDTHIAVFDQIFCDIGDNQSIASSLSTFSSHIVNIADIVERITAKSLILLDELGSGTDPTEGAALALGIIQFLEQVGASGIITTHYGALKQYAMHSKVLQNGCMRFDEHSLKPTYQLIAGIPGASHALKICASLGLNPLILKKATLVMDKQTVALEEVLAIAQKAKSDALAELEHIEKNRHKLERELLAVEAERLKLQEKNERLNENARIELRRIIGNNVEKAEELIEEIAALKNQADERSLLEAKRLRKQVEALQFTQALEVLPQLDARPLTIEEVKLGLKVFSTDLKSDAKIQSLPNKKGEVTVLVGSTSFKIHFSKLQIVPERMFAKDNQGVKSQQKNQASAKFTRNKHSSNTAVAVIEKEIKLLGLTVFEAEEAIDSLIMSDIDSDIVLKIVHGKGTGALGKGIQKYLKSLKCVKSVRYGGFGEGETGVTFAEIKAGR